MRELIPSPALRLARLPLVGRLPQTLTITFARGRHGCSPTRSARLGFSPVDILVLVHAYPPPYSLMARWLPAPLFDFACYAIAAFVKRRQLLAIAGPNWPRSNPRASGAV